MSNRPLYLIDNSSLPVATLDVTSVADHFEGTISLDSTPQSLIKLFAELEELVEGQVLSLLDEVEQRICALQMRVRFENGSVANVCDLQIYPSTNSVSFKIPQALPV
jgi:hypothetical protein